MHDTFGMNIASVDYRVAPHKYPAALEDALEAYNFYSLMYNEIIVIGDSAGGNLALSLTLKL